MVWDTQLNFTYDSVLRLLNCQCNSTKAWAQSFYFQETGRQSCGRNKKKKNPILFAKSVGGYGNLRAKITPSHAGSRTVTFLQAELKTAWSVLRKVDEKSKNKTADSKLRSADYTYVNHCWPWQELPPHYDKVWNLIEIFHKGHYFGGDP